MIHGKNQIGYELSDSGKDQIKSISAIDNQALPGEFFVVSDEDFEEAVLLASIAFEEYKNISASDRALFLETIASEMDNNSSSIIERAEVETGLPKARLTGEMGRTTGQLKLFAKLIREGSWVEAVIDTALPDRQPLPRPDIRKYNTAIGPVAVFTASNFPLAFSTAGGDTASALAAGCPVIIKAHESHLGTNQLVADAIIAAAKKCNMPEGVFSSFNASGYSIGKKLVSHPLIKSVAFTGSYNGGKALVDLASTRKEPIPVFAEMGSVNPVILCKKKLESEAEKLAETLSGSIILGCGQFCTNPGLMLAIDGPELDVFQSKIRECMMKAQNQLMLNQGIMNNYNAKSKTLISSNNVKIIGKSSISEPSQNTGQALIATVNGKDFLGNPDLQEEVFGPFSLLVKCADMEELKAVCNSLKGQLTGSFMATNQDLHDYSELISILQNKVGRLIFNSAPTGVEVGFAMQHGGPFPASSDSRFTSVGADAIKRFVRPIAFQGMPNSLLPDELKNENPLGIIRKVNGELSKDQIS